jgi:hypothetical protein
MFGSTIGEINNMSKPARFFENLWLVFAWTVTLLVTVAGVILVLPSADKPSISLLASVVMGLLWAFSVVQFLSISGYFRYRLRR